MSMSSSTPKYLNHIGLIDDEKYVDEDYETGINFLMSQVRLTIKMMLCLKPGFFYNMLHRIRPSSFLISFHSTNYKYSTNHK